MSARYYTNLLAALLGGFVVVVSMALTAVVLGWVAFGVGIGIVTMVALAQLDSCRGGVQRLLDLAMVAVGGLLIAFSLASAGAATIWLSFAFGLGIVGIAVFGMTLHEVSNWRASNELGDLRWMHGGHGVSVHGQSKAA